jgi:hypothetical protein
MRNSAAVGAKNAPYAAQIAFKISLIFTSILNAI